MTSSELIKKLQEAAGQYWKLVVDQRETTINNLLYNHSATLTHDFSRLTGKNLKKRRKLYAEAYGVLAKSWAEMVDVSIKNDGKYRLVIELKSKLPKTTSPRPAGFPAIYAIPDSMIWSHRP